MSNSPFAANDLARHRRSSSQILTTGNSTCSWYSSEFFITTVNTFAPFSSSFTSCSVPGDENLTPEERHIYSQLFKAADIDGKGIVLGEEAVEFFKKSGIPAQILSEVRVALSVYRLKRCISPAQTVYFTWFGRQQMMSREGFWRSRNSMLRWNWLLVRKMVNWQQSQFSAQ